MENMVTNVYVKSNYNWLNSNKALPNERKKKNYYIT